MLTFHRVFVIVTLLTLMARTIRATERSAMELAWNGEGRNDPGAVEALIEFGP